MKNFNGKGKKNRKLVLIMFILDLKIKGMLVIFLIIVGLIANSVDCANKCHSSMTDKEREIIVII